MHRLARLWTFFAAAFLLVSVFTQRGASGAQEGTEATVSALQTQAAGLKTMVALQTEVAALSTQVGALETPGPTGTPTPTPASTPPPPGTVLYEANVENGGFEQWAHPSWDILDGTLINTGSDMESWIAAPFDPGKVTNYAIEAEIEIVQNQSCGLCFFYFVVRDGFVVGFEPSRSSTSVRDDPNSWDTYSHDRFRLPDEGEIDTYRVEAEGNTIRLLVGNSVAVSGHSNAFVSREGGQVGLWTYGVDIRVFSFKIIAL